MNSLKIILLFFLIALLSGCDIHTTYLPLADSYYLNTDKDLSSIGRTALVELGNDSRYPHISPDVTESLYHALQKKQLFGLTLVPRNDPAWRSLQLQSQPDLNPQIQNNLFGVPPIYTLKQLSDIRKTLNCSAILIGTVTGFKPYPHLAVGLRLKLVDLKDGQLLWGLEQIWDTADKTTQRRIKNYYRRHILPGSASLQERLGTVSTIKFIKFVTYEIAETLQY